MEENNFERFPSSGEGEQVLPVGQDFEKSMRSDVPEFAGEDFGFDKSSEVIDTALVDENEENRQEYDAGISDAATLINYGLNAAAREMGVELVVQKLKNFDASGSDDPIRDFFKYLGVDNPEERKGVRDEGLATKSSELEFRSDVNAPTEKRSVEGAFEAIKDMKELISEVEGADPRYEELRAGARAAGKGYFEYAVSDFGARGLTELFTVLAQQKEKSENDENNAIGIAEDTNNEDNEEIKEVDGSKTLNLDILKKVD